MVGKDKKGDGSTQDGSAKKGDGTGGAAATPSSFAFMEWMLSKPKAASAVPPPTVEKHHWVCTTIFLPVLHVIVEKDHWECITLSLPVLHVMVKKYHWMCVIWLCHENPPCMVRPCCSLES